MKSQQRHQHEPIKEERPPLVEEGVTGFPSLKFTLPPWRTLFYLGAATCIILLVGIGISRGAKWLSAHKANPAKETAVGKGSSTGKAPDAEKIAPPPIHREIAKEPTTKPKQGVIEKTAAQTNVAAGSKPNVVIPKPSSCGGVDQPCGKQSADENSALAQEAVAAPYDFDAHPELWASWNNGGTLTIFWTHCQTVTDIFTECFGKVTGKEGKDFAFWDCGNADIQDDLGVRSPVRLGNVVFGSNYHVTLHYGSFVNFRFRYIDASHGSETRALPTMCIEFDDALGTATANHTVAVN